MAIRDSYAFLLDEDLLKLIDRFPKARVTTVVEVGLKGQPDSEVVRAASDRALIVLTNNTQDYTREMRLLAPRCTGQRRLYGLVTIGHATYEEQKRLFPLSKLEHRMTVRGRQVSWDDVSVANLWVHLRSERDVEVRRLPVGANMDGEERAFLDERLGPVPEEVD